MEIVKAKNSDLNQILEIYALAKNFMRNNGNTSQWQGNYPSEELLLEDIKAGELYILKDKKLIEAVFLISLNRDNTYNYIQGQWLNDDDYAVIHRVASRGRKKGVLKEIINFCLTKSVNIRIDTHESNEVMKSLVLKNGFVYCGKIFLEDGSERLAYHLSKK